MTYGTNMVWNEEWSDGKNTPYLSSSVEGSGKDIIVLNEPARVPRA